jgi:hypothetical protein
MLPDAPPTFAVECACGAWARGDRQPKPQVLTCTGCGKPVFIFPAADSVFGPVGSPPAAAWSARARFWLPPVAAAVLALAVVGVVIAAIVRSHRAADPASEVVLSDAQATSLLDDRYKAAKTALEEGSYRMARDHLEAARDLMTRYPQGLDDERARQMVHWRRQANLLADLLTESVGEIVRHSVGMADTEWAMIFRDRYAGQAVVLDTRVFRDAAGHIHVDYHLEAAGGVGEWELDNLRLFNGLPLQPPQRMIFGFRIRSIRRLARDRWTVVPDPESGVLLTDPIVLTGLSVPADDELAEVLRRQLTWDSDG